MGCVDHCKTDNASFKPWLLCIAVVHVHTGMCCCCLCVPARRKIPAVSIPPGVGLLSLPAAGSQALDPCEAPTLVGGKEERFTFTTVLDHLFSPHL